MVESTGEHPGREAIEATKPDSSKEVKAYRLDLEILDLQLILESLVSEKGAIESELAQLETNTDLIADKNAQRRIQQCESLIARLTSAIE